ncbi:MAG: hypothetical protein HQK49_12680 [Oligoflexia bacterium]|nr:hypothetical protein [Oligoflexia bacterium]
MNNCNHDKHSKKEIVKEVLKCKFKFKTMVCNECGHYLWDKEVEQKFNLWLEKLYKNKREKFQVQIPLSENLRKCLNKLRRNYPSVTDTDLVRAIIITYLDHLSTNKKLMKMINENITEEIINSFAEPPFSSMKVQFRPKYTIKYLELANMIGSTQAKVMQDAVKKLMAFFVATDNELKDFWNTEIKKYIDMLVA